MATPPPAQTQYESAAKPVQVPAALTGWTIDRGLPPGLGRVPWILVDAGGDPDGDRQGGGGAIFHQIKANVAIVNSPGIELNSVEF